MMGFDDTVVGHYYEPFGQEAAFDAVAEDYDAQFTDRRLGRWLRGMVWERLGVTFKAGERVLELGCGTGADALEMARCGVEVIATDASSEMLDVARSKSTAASIDHRLRFERLDFTALAGTGEQVGMGGLRSSLLAGGELLDGAYSNFGALNCIADRRPIAHMLQQVVRPGGYVVVVLMGPLCPWEILWRLLHGEVGLAARRLRAGRLAHVGGGRSVRVWYPTPRQLQAEFAPGFRLLGLEGVGVLLPPTDLSHLVERWPHAFEALVPLEQRLRSKLPWTWLNDHYLATFQRI